MPVVDKWVDIYSDLRPWAGAHEVHKMGWLREGDRIHLNNQYGKWFQFNRVVGGADLNSFDDDYDEWWVKGDELAVATTAPPEPPSEPEPPPAPGPLPTEVGDAEVGAAFRIVFDFFFGYFRGWV